MLKRVQHDKKKYVIPNQVLNLIQDLPISESRLWKWQRINCVCINLNQLLIMIK
jgi:hypothetical protein